MKIRNVSINSIWGITSQSKHLAVNNCRAIFNRFSEECIDPARALALLQAEDPTMEAIFKRMGFHLSKLPCFYALYSISGIASDQRNVRQTDFALLQQEAYKSWSNLKVRASVFKHVIVDEYQDTNTIQETIFFKLAKAIRNICVVGDDDQALYRFRGATVENHVEFPARCQQYLRPESPPHLAGYQLPLSQSDRGFLHNFHPANRLGKTRRRGLPGGWTKKSACDRVDDLPSVVASTPNKPDEVSAEIAELVLRIAR